ncbi:DUF1254 domain-containing protein [Nonomuraea dietziae]|uniref:DUF1254 domain-containing protein n=1 Tax=Nonomuraea dietziae TaxID=65515 RepID=A0A7W5VAU7_9ACTN|nr:DUF1254 domain-containing protein [Nonomuraea dietziae]MBB3728110.1 hypothetical protein [Nonomuraea dietziae]
MEAANEDVHENAVQAYIYGYPLVLMEATRHSSTNVEAPDPAALKAPINQLAQANALPDPGFKLVVSPNLDTLYTVAWLDLAQEPMVLHLPDTQGRYYLMPMLDAWTNVFASPGTRTTGTGEGDFAITGPNWNGTLPGGVEQLKSPTDTVWIIGRTQLDGPSDLPAVQELVDQYTLQPLSAYGRGTYTRPPGKVDPGIPMTPPPTLVEQMDAQTFFSQMAAAMRTNAPAAADKPMAATLAQLNIQPGQPFDIDAVDSATAQALHAAVPAAQERIKAAVAAIGQDVNGWRVATNMGSYGTDYLRRAATAWQGLGANLPQDAIYPIAFVDGQGQPLNGANTYTIHFPAGQLPPAKAFWSLTMYDPTGFLVDNPINRYEIGHVAKPVANPDGSVDLYIQHDAPADKQDNWLPAPAEGFNLILRMYWPEESVVDGTWAPPPITKAG